jgi:alcohol dehydrogenase
MREGKMAAQLEKRLPFVLGSDVAGIVCETIDGLKAGDCVYGQASILRGATGAYAELAVVPRDLIAKMPDNLSFAEAASIALVGTSALQALREPLDLKRGQKLLIHGAAGGIGSAAVQLTKHIGAYVAATEDGVKFVKQLGADEVLDFNKEDFSKRFSDFDCVLDTVAGETYKRSYQVLKRGGAIVSMTEEPDQRLMKQYGVNAVHESTMINRQHLDELTKLVEGGVILVYVEETYPLDEIREPFEAKEQGHVYGEIAIAIH